jgi:acetyl-CoA carboxylase biotin carboxylase subunit
MFKKVLVANRGEIACRVIRTLREMGIRSVAVYSDVDRAALHVRMADEAVPIGEAPASSSYLRFDRVLEAIKQTRADAVHPGYGFLSENAAFAKACADSGVVFIGPPASAISSMGSKTAARDLMSKAGVPVVPGATCDTVEEAKQRAQELGYPVMLKAAAGGGGKGMRLVHGADEMAGAWERAKSESKKAFGDDTVYLEKAIIQPRHVEIQVLGDRHGNVVHLFERDCSIQRRHQKVVEETPCPVLTQDIVEKMGEIAVKGAKAVDYFSAGTFEFLLSADKSFYFLEMNTRLQVEHPITEWVTGTDLVREMVRVAAGEPLSWTQEQIQRRGASIECRVYAEDPSTNFLPSPGTIEQLRVPSGPGVRDDSGAYPGCTISSYYDPLVSKLAVWAPTRDQAIARMRRALHEYVVTGIRTNLAFHERLMAHPDFVAGNYDTGFIDAHRDQLMGYGEPSADMSESLAVAVALAAAGLERKAAGAARAEVLDASRLSAWVTTHRSRRST